MHNSLLKLVVFAAFATGCNGAGDLRGKMPIGRLTPTDYERLKHLNELQQDNINARDMLYNFAPETEKSKAMAEKLAQNCYSTGAIPDNDMNGGQHTQTIEGSGCPISWYRYRYYNMGEKTVVYTDNLQIVDKGYRDSFSPMHARKMYGSYRVTPQHAGSRVSGVVKFTEFSTVHYGRIQGQITIEHSNSFDDRTTTGNVTLALSSTSGWAHTAAVQWTFRRGAVINTTHRIDGAKVEAKDFNGLFSAYELDKFMANAQGMK